MSHVLNDPTTFRDDVLAGFADAYSRYVERVPSADGLLRAGGARAGKVSLVVGGGSGHYPSYAGIVGQGLADACVLGEVFTSPSAEQVYRVARAADGGSGVVLAFGNYAGDRLNFAAARERLVDEGVDTRIVYCTDDVASAPAHESQRRRGIAGTAVIYKIGGSAADRGDDVAAVEALMRRANDRTRSFGVAFAGCTLPGAREPLFSVSPGQMELGLGIHGEPGVETVATLSASELGEVLVQRVLAEAPAAASGRAAVLLNGLGATKYEELFVLWSAVGPRLARAGIACVLPEVGELVTSLDMAGCSLSVTWLDPELEELWCAPVATAAFRRGVPPDPVGSPQAARPDRVVAEQAGETASAASRAAAVATRLVLDALVGTAREHETRWGRLDAVAGDGDHGTGMARGLAAASAAAHEVEGGAGQVLESAGAAFADRAGGTSGALWGVLLSSLGRALGNEQDVTSTSLARGVRFALQAVSRVGGAELGDKTMLDALLPFIDALDTGLAAGQPLAEAWPAAARVATTAAERTAELTARVGRARPMGRRSVGTPDPGAVSAALLLTRAGEVLAGLHPDGSSREEST